MSGTQARETTILAQEGSGKPYLGDPAAVDSLVRGFVFGVVDRVVAATKGETTGQEAAAEDQRQAAAFMAVIAGRDPAYTPMGGWNANETGGLKAWVRKTLAGIVSDAMLAKPDGPYEAVAAYLLHETYRALSDARAMTEVDLRDRLEATVEDGARLLLGIPSEAELEAAAEAAAGQAG